jgi:putative Mg2+ transporter-C (MgtC) family protein
MECLDVGEQNFRLILAVVLGMLVGLKREKAHKPAGLRINMLVSLGSCLFMIISLGFGVDPARIAAGVVAGVGFIDAGTVIAERNKIVGITTAASLWVTSAIGLATGAGNYILSVMASLLALLILSLRVILRKVYASRIIFKKYAHKGGRKVLLL